MSVIYSNSSPSYESCSSTLEEYRSPRGPAPPQVAQALRLPPTGLTAGPTARPPVGFGASGRTCAGAHDPGPKAPFAVVPFLQVFAPPAKRVEQKKVPVMASPKERQRKVLAAPASKRT
ncbi:hypothetical protein QE152_g23240 [Popillia japonica]|uniref:Uncharacterized protein n=1 Tax=Popillia japonica TaxID=7064 RepID=A0AAW1KHR4_POPJA